MKRIAPPSTLLALCGLPAAAMLVLALSGGWVDARQIDPAALGEARTGGLAIETDPALAWVDPVITGPVSPGYKRQRNAARCDEAVWPHIPTVCFPNRPERR